MKKRTLHITNGSELTERLDELNIKDDILTWDEMLCEGPTIEHIDTEPFLELRSKFIRETYNLEIDKTAFHEEISKLNNKHEYNEIVLWFEYDLCCHINLVAVISLLHQKQIELPLYLVCSGRVKGSSDLKGLNELSTAQLIKHYTNKVKLSKEDIDLAITVWGIYCGKDHNLLKPFIIEPSSFKYLSNCLKAHLERYPDSETGLNVMEMHILKTINDIEIKSKHHLLGYILNYQGYYGYGDIQIIRMIESLQEFYSVTEKRLELSTLGQKAVKEKKNVSSHIKTSMQFGGLKKADFKFDKRENKLMDNLR